MAASEGSVVSIYMDSREPVEEGDVVQTTTGRTYRVMNCRVQKRGIHKGRQHLMVLVIPQSDVSEDDKVHSLWWYSRSKTVR